MINSNIPNIWDKKKRFLRLTFLPYERELNIDCEVHRIINFHPYYAYANS